MSIASLYFHIPFCTKKCPYCHFYVVPDKEEFHDILRDGLLKEWRLRSPMLEGREILSVYFGGGTPSLYPPSCIKELLSLLQIKEGCEITLEANPEEVSAGLLSQFRAAGINRLSLGVQSLDDGSLQVLERKHSAKKAIDAIFAAHRAGFNNISIDLMYDLPGQTEESWGKTLRQLSILPITHLSLYNLTIEPHTPFYRRRKQLQPSLPNSELSLKLLEMGVEAIERAGLKRYEISAFAKEGYFSKHNVGYWTGRPFLGFGPSAFSYWEGRRFRNIANLLRYRTLLSRGQSPVDFEEKLPYPANVKERLAVQLRLLEGVDVSEWTMPLETQEALVNLKQQCFLEQSGQQWKLSPQGLLFYDSVATELIEAL